MITSASIRTYLSNKGYTVADSGSLTAAELNAYAGELATWLNLRQEQVRSLIEQAAASSTALTAGLTSLQTTRANVLGLTTPTSFADAAKGSNDVSLTWTDLASQETRYRIEQADSAATPTSWALAVTSTDNPTAANVTSITVTGLSPLTDYRWRIRAERNGSTGEEAQTAIITTLA